MKHLLGRVLAEPTIWYEFPGSFIGPVRPELGRREETGLCAGYEAEMCSCVTEVMIVRSRTCAHEDVDEKASSDR